MFELGTNAANRIPALLSTFDIAAKKYVTVVRRLEKPRTLRCTFLPEAKAKFFGYRFHACGVS